MCLRCVHCCEVEGFAEAPPLLVPSCASIASWLLVSHGGYWVQGFAAAPPPPGAFLCVPGAPGASLWFLGARFCCSSAPSWCFPLRAWPPGSWCSLVVLGCKVLLQLLPLLMPSSACLATWLLVPLGGSGCMEARPGVLREAVPAREIADRLGPQPCGHGRAQWRILRS